jgi:hypothetical protein
MTHEEALRKAMGCLRLAERAGTPDEAALAAAKAQKIIDDYKLDIENLEFDAEQLKEDKEEVKDFGYADPLDDVKYGNYRESWTLRLASIVAHSNQCEVRHTKKSDKGIKIRVIGRPSDVCVVRYLYSFFRIQIDELAAAQTKGNSSSRGEFCVGCIDTLKTKLEAQREATVAEVRTKHSGDEMSLVRVNRAVTRMENRAKEVGNFITHENAVIVSGRTGLDVNLVELFLKFKLDDAKALCQASGIKFAQARKAIHGCFGYSRGGGAGSKVSSGGRAHGQRAGQSIRMTGAKAGIGSGRKAIG